MEKNELKHFLTELNEENNRLTNQLLFANKCLLLFEKYRNYLKVLCVNCCCDQNKSRKLQFNDLEEEYNSVFSDTKDVNCLSSDEYDTTKQSDLINEDSNETEVNSDSDVRPFDNQLNEKHFKHKTHEISLKPIYDDNSEITGYRCGYSFCDYEHKIKGNVSKHVKKMHINKQPLNCDKCDQKLWGRQRLIKHRQSVHFDTSFSSNDRKKFKCDWNSCQFESKSLNSMREHIKRHLGDKQFHCDVSGCESSFVTNNELKMHRTLIHSDEMPFRCEWPACESAFKTSKYLKYHMYSHTGDYPCICDYPECGMKFVKNCDLKYHKLVTHSDERPFRCEWPGCEFSCKTKNSLRLHNFTHTGERPLVCEWPGCDASFYMNSHLKRHKRIHDSDKKYACDWPDCKKRFTDNYNLKMHMMAHKGEKPIRCELWPKCHKMFAEKSRMNIHVRKMHRNRE